MPSVTVSGAGGRTFTDPSMGGAAYQPTAFDPFGYSPSYSEAFGTQGFYPSTGGAYTGGGGYAPTVLFGGSDPGLSSGVNPYGTQFASVYGPAASLDVTAAGTPSAPYLYDPNFVYGTGGPPTDVYGNPIAPPGTGQPVPIGGQSVPVAAPPQGFVTNFVPVGGGAAGGSSGTMSPVIIVPIGGSAAGGTSGQTPGIAGPAVSSSAGGGGAVGTGQVGLTPASPFSGGGTGSGAGGVGPQFSGGGGQTPLGSAVGGYSPSPSATSVDVAFDLTGTGGGWSPGSHQSFGGIQQRGGRVPWTGPAWLHEGEKVIPRGGTMADANKPVSDFGWFPTPPSWGGGGGAPGPVPRQPVRFLGPPAQAPPPQFPPFPTLPPPPTTTQGLPGYFNSLRTTISPWLQMVPGWGGMAMMGR